MIKYELHHMGQRREITQRQPIITLNPILITQRRKRLRLLHRINPQIRLEIQIQLQHLNRIPRLNTDHTENGVSHRLATRHSLLDPRLRTNLW